jgi:phenylpropionate dioxygenase-like ring-hydroxylating dioxygenase large terminal subunit
LGRQKLFTIRHNLVACQRRDPMTPPASAPSTAPAGASAAAPDPQAAVADRLNLDPAASPEPGPPVGAAWWNCWLPVAYLRDLDPGRPRAQTVLDRDLVLWFEASSQRWRALEDACPHRLAPLSEGRLNARGELECPYHGWSFEGSGRCTAIPQAEDGAALSSRRSSCRSYATAVGQGLLFVFMGEAERAEAVALPLLPDLDEEPERWLLRDTFRDLPMDALTALENVLDVSHVPFTHHRTVGRRENAAPVRAELGSFGPEGFTAFWPEGPRRGKLGSQHTTFLAPCLMWHDLTAQGIGRILTVVYVTPVRRGECRLFARFPLRFNFNASWPGLLLRLSPEWLQHIGNNKVLEDDQVFLHWQERAVERRGGLAATNRSFHLATGADVYVRALLRWAEQAAGQPFPGQPLPPRLERGALMDRLHSHTRHCRSCSTALRRIRRWRPLALSPALLALIVPWRAAEPSSWPALVLCAGLLMAAVGLWQRLGRWELQLQQGDGEAPRNRD